MTLEQIAYDNGLDLVETTSELNGYPKNLRFAIIGMQDFKEAEELAKKYNLSIELINKQNGWHLWARNNYKVYEPLRNSASDYGDDYMDYNGGDAEAFFECEKGALERDFQSLEELEELVKNWREIADEIEKAGSDKLVITYQGRYYETIAKESMEWSHDGKTTCIALLEQY